MESPTSFLIHPLDLAMDVGEDKKTKSSWHIVHTFTQIAAWSLKSPNMYLPLYMYIHTYIKQPVKATHSNYLFPSCTYCQAVNRN